MGQRTSIVVAWCLSVGALSVVGCSSDSSDASGVSGNAGVSASAGVASAGSAGSAHGGSTSGAGAGGAGGSQNHAGSGGVSNAGGRGGSPAAGGAGGSSSAQPSAGCTKPPVQELGKWAPQPTLNVASVDRQWWVWLPTGYDPSRAYPVVFLFHGCSGADNVVPMQNVTKDQAILVRGAGVSSGICWDASSSGPDVTFFDQMRAQVLTDRCVDQSRVFAAGYSSGSWLINTLDCIRADKLRAAGSVSGGVAGTKNCTGQIARVFIHDADDTTNVIAGSITERDRLLAANHCSTTTAPVTPAPCVAYQGCDAGYPVVWCQTSMKGHDRQDALAPTAFWNVFSKL